MGLDMYLRAERFLSGGEMVGEFKAPDESLLNLEGSGFTAMEVIPVPNEHKPAFDRLVELLEFDDHVCEAAPYATVSFVVAYWRKGESRARLVRSKRPGRRRRLSSL